MPSKVWDEITYPFPNFNRSTIEVFEWISNFIPHFIMDVISHLCTCQSIGSTIDDTGKHTEQTWASEGNNILRCIFLTKLLWNSIFFPLCPTANKLQSTPFISRLLGAKICERELSGSPVISCCHAKATTREFRITDPHSQVFTTLKQYVER